MKRWMALSLLCGGCVVARPVGTLVTVPPDTAQQCDTACGAMGMVMSAVVLVSNRAGCVCERTPGSAPRAAGAAATAAGVVIAIDEEEAARQQQQQASSPPPAPPGSHW